MKYDDNMTYSLKENYRLTNDYFKPKKFDMLEENKQKRLTMRKDKLMKYLIDKRKINMGNREYNEISLSGIGMNEEMRSFELNDIGDRNQVEKVKMMLESNDISTRNYILYHLKNYFAYNILDDLTLFKEFNMIQLLIDILVSNKSINVQNVIYSIFINYSYSYCEENCHIKDDLVIFSSKDKIELYKESLSVISINDITLRNTLLQFLTNICYLNFSCRQMIYEQGIFDILMIIIKDKDDTSILWLMASILKNQCNINERDLLNGYGFFLKHYLNHNENIKKMLCSLYGLLIISDYNHITFDFITMIIKDHLIEEIIKYDYTSLFKTEKENIDYDSSIVILKYSLQIITNVLLTESHNMTEYLISIHFLDFLSKILQSFDSISIIKEIFSIIHNLSVGSVDDIMSLVSHDIFKSVESHLIHFNTRLKIESAQIIHNTLHYKTYDISKLVYSSTLKDSLINIITNETNQELISISLQIILQFLCSDKAPSTPFLVTFQLNSLEDLLEKHLLSNDKEIMLTAENIKKHIKSI